MVNVMKASFAPKRLYLAGLALLVLALAVFVQAAFNLESFLSPSFPNQIVLFFTLSTIVFLVLTVSAFILARSLFKLLMERRSEKPGARFKTRLVMSMILLTLFPAIALFAFAFGLVNRSIDKWFSVPVDRVFETAADIQTEWTTEHESAARGALMEIAAELPVDLDRTASNLRLDAVAVLDETGRVVRGSSNATAYAEVFREQLIQANGETRAAAPPILVAQPDGSLVGLVPVTGSEAPLFVAAAFHRPDHLEDLTQTISAEFNNYEQLIADRWFYRDIYVQILALMTILVLFAAVWTGLFLSKRITVPIEALSGATREISAGNLNHRVDVKAEDELGMLVGLFNNMAGRLQVTTAELEDRRRYTETILESIPTGVISIDEENRVTKINRAARTMFSIENAETLEDILNPNDLEQIGELLRLCRQEGASTREMTLQTDPVTPNAGAGDGVHSAVNVSQLATGGYVIVVEDLTEVAKAQKATVWRDVARRLAHEIKNPLTPIQLSAERIARNVDRSKAMNTQTAEVIRECVDSIVGEVGSLKALVNEFGRVAQLPSISRKPTPLKALVDRTLALYEDRFNGIRVRSEIPEGLPPLMLDGLQIKRVLINLIDNALDSMSGQIDKELRIDCELVRDNTMARLSIADSGHGISPEDKDRLFTPYFSTRKDGTGLGLVIASRIVADHGGYIGAESNGHGARFIVELPVCQES